ncbi:uncharacterized protein LOC143770404 isoform X2 [Ranitomeya variabilis]|uniref:uncharacterized protein LOC143770404 isoform X2 n=1 Tax=Ranitomeya variabilis TaxID=490064 RepID=UPI0040561A5D
MECTGEETLCVLTNETLLQKHNVYSFGCGTKSVIQKNGNLHNLLSLYSSINITKSTPIPGLKPGNFLWCYICYNDDTASCAKKTKVCEPDEDVCLTERRRITGEQSRKLTMQVRRRCAKSEECQFSGVISGRDKTLTIKTSCCDSDICTTPVPQWPLKKRRKSNGKTCPTCFSNDSNCHATNVIQCDGDETRCIYYSSRLTEFH